MKEIQDAGEAGDLIGRAFAGTLREFDRAAAAIASAAGAGESGPVRLTQADHKLFKSQRDRVLGLMIDGAWRTLQEIAGALEGCSEASASARLRDLRKRQYGAFEVVRRKRFPSGSAVLEYRVTAGQFDHHLESGSLSGADPRG